MNFFKQKAREYARAPEGFEYDAYLAGVQAVLDKLRAQEWADQKTAYWLENLEAEKTEEKRNG